MTGYVAFWGIVAIICVIIVCTLTVYILAAMDHSAHRERPKLQTVGPVSPVTPADVTSTAHDNQQHATDNDQHRYSHADADDMKQAESAYNNEDDAQYA